MRTGLNKDLGFTAEDRNENIRRISEVAKLFNLSQQICICSFIAPYKKERDFAREVHEASGLKFYEGYVATSLEVCEGRDVKGLYKKAREGLIPNFTGVSDPYEEPETPNILIQAGEKTVDQCVDEILDYLQEQGVITLPQGQGKCSAPKTLYDFAPELKVEAESLPSIELDEEHVQYLHVLADGWAGSLDNFMSEMQLLETLHYKTITTPNGKKQLQAVPITCPTSTE